MKTIGELIKQARLKSKYSRSHLEKLTKIKRDFIKAIEKENWNDLPEYPVVVGFIKNLAGALDINPKTAVAVLRRDYPPKNLPINPKPDVGDKRLWSPRLTFSLGVVLVTLGIIGYLVFQYINFIKPPVLVVNTPKDGQIVTDTIIEVSGKTNPEATIVINKQPVLVDDDGNFKTQLEVFEGTKDISIRAVSRSGKVT